jgi:hypothetical protein
LHKSLHALWNIICIKNVAWHRFPQNEYISQTKKKFTKFWRLWHNWNTFCDFRSSQNLFKIISWEPLIAVLKIFKKMSATPTRRKNRHCFIHVQMRNNAVQSCTEYPRNKQLYFYITVQYNTVQYNRIQYNTILYNTVQ